MPVVRIVGIIVAALAYFLVGFVFYGLLFGQVWMNELAYTEEQFEGQSPLWMLASFVIPLVVSTGLSMIMKAKDWPSLDKALLIGVKFALLFGVPMMGYQLFYSPHHSVTMFLIDSAHIIIGWSLAAVIVSKLR